MAVDRSCLRHRAHRGLQLGCVDEGVLAGYEPVRRDVDDIEAVEAYAAGDERPVEYPMVLAVEHAIGLRRQSRELLEDLGKGGAHRVTADDGLPAHVRPEPGVLGVQRDDRIGIACRPRGEVAHQVCP